MYNFKIGFYFVTHFFKSNLYFGRKKRQNVQSNFSIFSKLKKVIFNLHLHKNKIQGYPQRMRLQGQLLSCLVLTKLGHKKS